MILAFHPVRLGASSPDDDARLVFEGEELIAIFSHLSELHGDEQGKWFLEIGFGRLGDLDVPLFTSLDEVRRWVSTTLSADKFGRIP